MLITSMNFYDFSMQNNKEMGIYLNRERDNELFEDAMNEVQSIIRHSTEENKYINKRNEYNNQKNQDSGYCT